MSDAPYFSFWAKDWLTGEGTRLMTPEQKGAFIDLLSHAWLSGSEPCTLPADDAALSKLSGLGRRWAKVGAAVRAQFQPTESGRLRNERLYQVWSEMEERHGRRVAAGAKGGKAKAANAKQSSSNATAMLKQPKPKPKAKTEKQEPSFPAAIYDWLQSEWAARFGVVTDGQFRAGIKPLLLAGLRPGQLARAFAAYREDRDEAKKPAKFAWFLEDVQHHVHEGDLCAIQLVDDPAAFGLTQAEANEKIRQHQARLAEQDAATLDRILGRAA